MQLSDGFSREGVAVRQSTLLRLERLSKLIGALSRCDMGYRQAATLLQCSPSAARSYMFELMDAEVIVSTQERGSPRVPKPVYRLNPDQCVVDRYQAALGNAPEHAALRAAVLRRDLEPDRGLHRRRITITCANSAPPMNGTAVQRDPLVAALFGTYSTAGAQP